MTSETDKMRAANDASAPAGQGPDQDRGQPNADAGQPDEAPRTPEELMQAATDRIGALETELAEMRDRWMRAEAETANVRARARREVDETRQYAVQKFAADVVEAAENLHRGLDSLPQPTPGEPEIVTRLRDGIAGVERSFLGVLERNGIRREDPTGAAFDPNLHQAMGEQESSQQPPGTVVQAWTPAWTLNGRLLRPAMVIVAKAPPGQSPAQSPVGQRSSAHPPAHPKVDTTA